MNQQRLVIDMLQKRVASVMAAATDEAKPNVKVFSAKPANFVVAATDKAKPNVKVDVMLGQAVKKLLQS